MIHKIIFFALLPSMAFHFGVNHLWTYDDEEACVKESTEVKVQESTGYITLDDLSA